MPRRKFGTEWKSENWKELAGSDFRFWNSVGSQKCYPKEMLSRRKISKWEITGWERLSLLEFCCFSKRVTIKNFPEWKSASGKDLAGSGFRFWKCAVSQTLLSDRKLVPNETPQVGTSGLVATFVSWLLRFLKKNVARRKFAPEGKSESWDERAGNDFRFWSFAVSQKMCPEWNLFPKENPNVGKSGLGATFVSGALMVFKNVIWMNFCFEWKSAMWK